MDRILLREADAVQIIPSVIIRQNYNEIAALCKSTGEPMQLMKNGEGSLIVDYRQDYGWLVR